MRTVLVTGGAGFIGSHIVGRLIESGMQVRVLDDLSSGKRTNLAPWLADIDFREGSVCSEADCRDAVTGVDTIFHQAAIASVPRSVAEPERTHEVNLNGSLRLLVAARDAGVRRVVFASSSAIYGDDPVQPKREEMMPCPISPYGLHKLTVEYYLRMFHRLYGLETVALRYFNVFGPRQDPKSEYAAVIPKFITRMLQNQAPTVFGDGRQTRDFIYVGEVARANMLAAEAPDAPGRIINIAGGRQIDLLDLIATINDVLKTRIRPVMAAPQPGDVRDSSADITMAEKCIGFVPEVDVVAGLHRTIDWYRENLRG
ncbi:MAG TPA: SDR family oxidoreductase [Candidatus Ozemobacteraceae bacterium]|nr:SDR family oxidoreductase [Candidatus Ozemobacteraceae bacterium]